VRARSHHHRDRDLTAPQRGAHRRHCPELRSRAVIIGGGHGAFEPKKLPGYDMSPWEGRGAHYLVGSKSEFAGKRVLIIGGGDSACDWVVNLVHTAESVALCHRREGFRAHELTVKQVMDAADAGHVDLHVPFQVREVSGNGTIERVRLFHSEDESREIELEVDAILLQLGFKTALGPLKDWGLEISKGAIVVDQVMRTNLPGVWACGDITTFEASSLIGFPSAGPARSRQGNPIGARLPKMPSSGYAQLLARPPIR
jgi:thioredoxin reductase